MLSHTAALFLLTTLTTAAPFTFPLPDGFPTPSNASLATIQRTAGGTLGNGPVPTGLDPETINSFGLIAFNEIFEVAFFSELVSNITQGVEGYQLPPEIAEYTVASLQAVVAQEELHALTANAIRTANGASAIQPCDYNFPVSTYTDAIALAQTFTDVVLGVLPDVEANAVKYNNAANAAAIVASLSSIIGQEGQQDGYYRAVQNKRPSAEPFLTGATREFAFTALVGFTVPGSCPNQADIKFNTFQALTLLTKDTCGAKTLEFSATNTADVKVDAGSQKLVYINGANLPIVVDFTVKATDGDVVTIEAAFPHDEFVMDGLTIAAIVSGAGPFSGPDDVAKAAVFAPGLIEVN